MFFYAGPSLIFFSDFQFWPLSLAASWAKRSYSISFESPNQRQFANLPVKRIAHCTFKVISKQKYPHFNWTYLIGVPYSFAKTVWNYVSNFSLFKFYFNNLRWTWVIKSFRWNYLGVSSTWQRNKRWSLVRILESIFWNFQTNV